MHTEREIHEILAILYIYILIVSTFTLFARFPSYLYTATRADLLGA